MTGFADAQLRILDDAQVTWAAAIRALDAAKGAAETLSGEDLMIKDDYWEAIAAFDSVTTLLEELSDMVSDTIGATP